MRPFPHSSKGVHTYRNHAEIYSAPRRHVGEIIWDKSRPEESSRRAPPSERRLLGGASESVFYHRPSSNKTNCSATVLCPSTSYNSTPMLKRKIVPMMAIDEPTNVAMAMVVATEEPLTGACSFDLYCYSL